MAMAMATGELHYLPAFIRISCGLQTFAAQRLRRQEARRSRLCPKDHDLQVEFLQHHSTTERRTEP